MSKKAKTREWPLAVFTLAIQLACALALATALSDWAAAPAYVPAIRPLGIAVFPIVALGMLVSLLHLGRPLTAWRSVINLGHSRLSLEVLLTGSFSISALIYSVLWMTGNTIDRLPIGIATSLLGLAAVGSSALIYAVPSEAFWNSAWLPVSFFGTTLLLSGLSCLAVATPTTSIMTRVVLGAILAAGLILFTSVLLMLRRLAKLRRSQLSAPRLDEPVCRLNIGHLLCVALHVLLAATLPFAFALSLWTASGTTANLSTAHYAPIVFLAAVIGALLGRILMYSLPASLSRF